MDNILPESVEFISKIRENGSSLIVTIPKNTCKYCKIKNGDELKFKIILEKRK